MYLVSFDFLWSMVDEAPGKQDFGPDWSRLRGLLRGRTVDVAEVVVKVKLSLALLALLVEEDALEDMAILKGDVLSRFVERHF